MNKKKKIFPRGKNQTQLKDKLTESQSISTLQAVTNTLLISFQGGHYQAAVNLAKNIITQYPDHAFSWKVLGAALKNLGKLEESLEAKSKAASLSPQDAEAHSNLGTTLQELGRLEEAEVAYKRSIAINPSYLQAHINLGSTFQALGRLEEAHSAYKRAIAIKPDYAETYSQQGIVLNQLKRLEEAEASYKKAIELKPSYAEALCNLGITLKGLGRFVEAEASYKKAIELKHDLVVAHSNLGFMLQELGRLEEAKSYFKKIISIGIRQPEIYNNLGTIHQELGQFEEAKIIYEKAIAIRPNYAEAHSNLGTILQELGQLDRAEASYKKAIEIKSNYAEAHSNLGAMQRLKGQYVDALTSISSSLAINNKNARTLQEYSTLQAQMSNFHDVCKYSNEALKLVSLNIKNQQASKLWESRLYTWIYHPDLSAQEICAEYVKWGNQFIQNVQEQFSSRDRTPNRKLRIGYVSPDFRGHSCRFYFEPLFSSHDRANFELYAYANVKLEDEHTVRFKEYFSVWRNIVGAPDKLVAQMILDDEIDILIDGCGHMGDTRLKVFAYKPAPIQVTWLGAAWTTGLPQMDYAMFDPYMAPEGTPVSEEIVHLPHTWTSFRPGEKAINTEVKPSPVIKNGYVTFGYTGRTERLNHKVFKVWGRILSRLPNSYLLLDFKSFGDPKTQAYYSKFLKGYGVDITRIIMRNSNNIFESLCDVDILLDSFPHNGGTMLFDAAWMGVPIVTLASNRPVGRIGASLMNNLGLPEWVAKSELEYEDKAVAFAKNVTQLARLRDGMRVRMQNSPVMNEKLFAQNVESAYRKMWGSWLANASNTNIHMREKI
jgi:predicted O-linked N-acetylglucosamine transferase (SPINDLY family)